MLFHEIFAEQKKQKRFYATFDFTKFCRNKLESRQFLIYEIFAEQQKSTVEDFRQHFISLNFIKKSFLGNF